MILFHQDFVPWWSHLRKSLSLQYLVWLRSCHIKIWVPEDLIQWRSCLLKILSSESLVWWRSCWVGKIFTMKSSFPKDPIHEDLFPRRSCFGRSHLDKIFPQEDLISACGDDSILSNKKLVIWRSCFGLWWVSLVSWRPPEDLVLISVHRITVSKLGAPLKVLFPFQIKEREIHFNQNHHHDPHTFSAAAVDEWWMHQKAPL